jgi:lipopolysaccharide biosynthesis glycosyltransferase
MIRITISSDAKGHGNSATLIASILRRTQVPVHVRCWCRGYLPMSFQQGPLKVEFFPAEEEVTGVYPGHVNPAVFDRLRVIRDGADWDRCLVMDHDMIVLCDLAPYFKEDFDGHLLMGRLFGPGNTLGLQMQRRGGLPAEWKHAEEHPYFFMGPMMNLAAMRAEGIWETLLEAHAAIGQDEQLSLTAACGGRTKGVGKKWNVVPQWDDLAAVRAPARGAQEIAGIPWRDGVPEGVIHWTGPSKPWHRGAKVWRADLWEGERMTWEHLRAGLWEKPLAVEIEPDQGFGVRALARRGWRVEVIGERFSGDDASELDAKNEPNPEVRLGNGGVERLAAVLAGPQGVRAGAKVVRFGKDSRPGDWLEPLAARPRYVAVKGPMDVVEMRRLRRLGYGSESRLKSMQWPTGGPSPAVLTFQDDLPVLAVAGDEEVYLRWVAECDRKRSGPMMANPISPSG